MLTNLKPYHIGCQCKFFKLPDGTGLKTFQFKNRRDHCYFIQQKAFEAGLAPEPFQSLELITDDKYKYAYVTELIETHLEKLAKEYGTDINTYYWSSYKENQHPKGYDRNIKKDRIKLYKDLRKAGFKSNIIAQNFDLTDLNVGWKDNKLMLIDFGDIHYKDK